jgi:hypothetical protein
MNLAMAITPANVTNARDMYHSTAIELRVDWRDFEATQGTYNWVNVDAAINNILDTSRGNMNLSIRVNLNGKPEWARPIAEGGTIANDRFMADQTGNLYVAPVAFATLPYNRTVFSFASDDVRVLLSTTYANFLAHVRTYINTNFPAKLGNLLVVTPVLNFYEESEYPEMPVDRGVDYSASAITKFRLFLERKYNSIASLNLEWSSPAFPNNTANFTNFNQIIPANYNWHLHPTTVGNNITNYSMFTGRRDWIEYRASELKILLDAIYQANRNQGIRFGIRLGSIHDLGIEMRGFHDVTPLLENADWVHVAPIIEQAAGNGFEIQADYLRSICSFWGYKKNKVVRFSEESNWRGFNGHSAATLVNGWNNQISVYRDLGASAHFMFEWDNTDSWLPATRAAYQGYIDHLNAVRNSTIPAPNRTLALHLSTSRVAINLANIPAMIMPAPNFNNQVYSPNAVDFITDFMLNDGPTYASRYNTVHMPSGSYHIGQKAFHTLLNNGVNSTLSNATHFNNGYGQFLVISGRANWVARANNQSYQLIWRTRRAELSPIWPTANKTAVGQGAVHPELDFIEWLIETNQVNAEYPELNMNYGNWDADVRSIWLARGDLQSVYPDGYHASGTNVFTQGASTLLDWVLLHGINEYPAVLGKFRAYPYMPALFGDAIITPPSVNLAVDGKVDWAHYGLNTLSSFNHRSGVTSQIGNVVKIGSGTAARFTNNTTSFTWSNGTPTTSATNTLTGIQVTGVNSGFQVSVPANRSLRTVQVYVGVVRARGRLEATLSDGSMPAYVNSSISNTGGRTNSVYTLNFSSASAGQALNIRWIMQADHGSGNVTLQGVSLW